MSFRPIVLDSRSYRFRSIEDLLAVGPRELPSSIVEITGPQPIFVNWMNRGAEITLVIFTATIPSTREITVPVFSGFKLAELLPWTNVLMVADPAVELDEDVYSGWHTGTKLLPRFQRQVSEIISGFGGAGGLVLFGGSSGGFAALEQGTRLPGSTVVVANPQTDARRHGHFYKAVEKAWGLEPEQTDLIPAQLSVLEPYAEDRGVRIVYLQNTGDTRHVEEHWKPFIQAVHSTNPVHSITPNIGRGHLVFDRAATQRVLAIVTRMSDWDEIGQKLGTVRFGQR